MNSIPVLTVFRRQLDNAMDTPLIPSFFLPVINGLIGDKLAQNQPKWSIQMSFRVDGQDVPVAELGKSLRGQTVLVFVHGLMADEKIWKDFRFGRKNLSVLHIRYNTGLHISQNGKLFAELMESLQRKYAIKKILLVGHSMGGLVVRSGCFYGQKKSHRWVKRVPVVFLLAVPNAGAAIEKINHVTSFVLRRIARWYLGHVGNLIEQRSNGIKDLRLGFMVDEDWKNEKSKRPGLYQRVQVPPLRGVHYHIILGSLSKDEKSLLARYFGDGLVTPGSAVAKTLLSVSHVKTFPGTGHNALLRRPNVHRYVKGVVKPFL